MKDKKEMALKKADQPAQTETNEVVYVPYTDIYEKPEAILIRCDMPGVSQDQIDIHLENNELEIIGTQAKSEQQELPFIRREYETGTYRRRFSIPQSIDHEHITARLHNGVLTVELPKSEQAKPRKIAITAGN